MTELEQQLRHESRQHNNCGAKGLAALFVSAADRIAELEANKIAVIKQIKKCFSIPSPRFSGEMQVDEMDYNDLSDLLIAQSKDEE